MNINMTSSERDKNAGIKLRQFLVHTSPILALHCSGADSSQWYKLKEISTGPGQIESPDLIGTARQGHWPKGRNFNLCNEAEALVAILRRFSEPAHIVAHSYGAGVALHIARQHPALVKSLCLYEPTLFCCLRERSGADQKLFQDIEALTRSIKDALDEDNPLFAAQLFTDFWGGLGAWQCLNRDRRDAMTDWVRKAPLDFHALMYEADPQAIGPGRIPTTVMVGGNTHIHTQRIADILHEQSPDIVLKTVVGAGHLGPFSFRDTVTHNVIQHIQNVEKSCTQIRL